MIQFINKANVKTKEIFFIYAGLLLTKDYVLLFWKCDLVVGTIPNSSDSSEKSSDHKRSVFKPRLMHLISVGFDVMVLETWLDICTGTAKHVYIRHYCVRLNNTGQSTLD